MTSVQKVRLPNLQKPHIAVPVHGEAEHMAANAEVAKQSHIPIQLVGSNGDLFELAPKHRLYKSYCINGVLTLEER